MDLMHYNFCSLALNLQVEDIMFFENSMCLALPMPSEKKALAICVQSSSSVMPLSSSQNDEVAMIFSIIFLLMSNFVVLEISQ